MEDEASIIEILNGDDGFKVSAACRCIIKQHKYSSAVSHALEPWIWKGSPAVADIVIRAYHAMGDKSYCDLSILLDRVQDETVSKTAIVHIIWGLGLFPGYYPDLYNKLSSRILNYSGKPEDVISAYAHTMAGILVEFKKTGTTYDKNVLKRCKKILEDSFRLRINRSSEVILRDLKKAGL
jgi:hypothetical protein